MKILFDELSYAESLLKQGTSKYISTGDLKILTKYFKYKDMDSYEIKRELEKFCEKNDPQYNEVLWEPKIKKGMDYAKNGKLKIPIDIHITNNELQIIKSIKNYKFEKVVFVLLCLAKYNKSSYEYLSDKILNGYFVNTLLPSVLKIAKVCLKREEQNNMLKFLREKGLIVATASRYNEGGYEILFADNNYSDEDVSITISSYSNVVSFYPTYCKFCGEPLKKSHNRNEMHPGCWKEHIKEYDRARKY